MSRSAQRRIKSTTIGCEWAWEALLRQVQAHLAASPVQRRVMHPQPGYPCKRIGPMLGERPIGITRIEHFGGNAAELCRWRDHCDGQSQCPQLDLPGTSRVETAAKRDLLRLELVHLGTGVRRVRTQADPAGFDALQQLMLDAARRAGGDRFRSGEAEMNLRLAGSEETLVAGVVA